MSLGLGPAGPGRLAAAAVCGFVLAKITTKSPSEDDDLVEVGEIGGNLRYWRAKEALRHGELRRGVQAQATQALEARATAMLGWSVAGVLALGAAVGNGTHAIAAGLAALCLIGAALLCAVAILTREWSGPGYRPEVILDDRSATELEAIESMVGGYSQAVQSNHDSFFRVKMLLHIALLCVLAAPITGAAALAVGWYRSLPLSI